MKPRTVYEKAVQDFTETARRLARLDQHFQQASFAEFEMLMGLDDEALKPYGLPKSMVERVLIKVYQTVVLDQQRNRDQLLMAAQAAASDGDPSPGGHHKAAPMMDRYGQTSLLVGSWSSAEGRWVEAYQGSPSGGFGLSRYSDCGVDSCRSFYFIGQPTVRLTQSSLVS